jgi:hypothetical protein
MVIAGVAAAQLAIGGSVAAVALSSAGSPAFADSGGYCSSSANGCTQSFQNSANKGNGPCADHGAFGAFGTFGDAPHDFGQGNPNGPGANGQATGAANSSVCGNPQGNP